MTEDQQYEVMYILYGVDEEPTRLAASRRLLLLTEQAEPEVPFQIFEERWITPKHWWTICCEPDLASGESHTLTDICQMLLSAGWFEKETSKRSTT